MSLSSLHPPVRAEKHALRTGEDLAFRFKVSERGGMVAVMLSILNPRTCPPQREALVKCVARTTDGNLVFDASHESVLWRASATVAATVPALSPYLDRAERMYHDSSSSPHGKRVSIPVWCRWIDRAATLDVVITNILPPGYSSFAGNHFALNTFVYPESVPISPCPSIREVVVANEHEEDIVLRRDGFDANDLRNDDGSQLTVTHTGFMMIPTASDVGEKGWVWQSPGLPNRPPGLFVDNGKTRTPQQVYGMFGISYPYVLVNLQSRR